MSPAGSNSADRARKSPSDAQLVKECLAGSEEAWALLVEKYKALIYSIPVKYGLAEQERADVFQSTCVELLTRLPDLRKVQALPKWLIQVAHHQCYHWKKQEARVVSRDADPEPVDPEIPAVAESLLRQSEEEQILREAVASLAPRCRRLVELLFYQDQARPYGEIAAELGLAEGSIGFIRQKCLERLRRRLEEMGFA